MKLRTLLYKMGLGALVRTAMAVVSCMPSLFWVKMDLDREHNGSGAFSDERLFTVSQNTGLLELDFIINAVGGQGLMQVSDNNSGRILWQREITGSTVFTQEVGPLEKGREYAVRFSGMTAGHVTITVSSRSEFIQELVHPSALSELAGPA